MSETTERYTSENLIGEGAMAAVYAAQDSVLERYVAMKCLKDVHAADDEKYARFIEEAKIMARLGHPGVIPVFDAGTNGIGQHFYTMKKVQGSTFRDVLGMPDMSGTRERTNIDECVDIFERVCETIGHAHSENVVHRDLKPENIMVDDFGAVYVMDWGIAKTVGQQSGSLAGAIEPEAIFETQAGHYLGSPAYMSPEQAEGQAHLASPGSDIFALGIILYEILTGTLPFKGRKASEMLENIQKQDPAPPKNISRLVSKELSAICIKCLEKAPGRRYQTAADLLSDLKNYRYMRPITALEPTAIDMLWYWSRRNRGRAAALATACVLLLLVGSWAADNWYEEQVITNQLESWVGNSKGIIDRLESEVDTLREQRDELVPGSREYLKVEMKLRARDSRLAIEHFAASRGLSALVGLTFLKNPELPLNAIKQQNLRIVDYQMAAGKYMQAQTFITVLLENERKGGAISYTSSERAQLQTLRAAALEELASELGDSARELEEILQFEA